MKISLNSAITAPNNQNKGMSFTGARLPVPKLKPDEFIPNYKLTTFLLASDIDGTWKSAKPELAKYSKILDNAIIQISENCAKVGINFHYGQVTARPAARVVSENITPGQFTMTDNGTTIWQGAPRLVTRPIAQEWEKIHKDSGFETDRLLGLVYGLLPNPRFRGMEVETVGVVVKNPAADGCKYIASLCIPNESIKLDAAKGETAEIFDKANYKTPSQVKEYMAELESQMKELGINYQISPAYLFSGKPYVMFDIAAPHANKGDAVRYMAKNLDPKNVIVAGDGGNDIAMMDNDGRSVIVVGNDKQLKDSVAKLTNNLVVIEDDAEKPCSIALLDGLVKVLKTKSHELFEKGLIKSEPDLDHLVLEPRANDSATAWKDYFNSQDEKEAFKKTVGIFA